MNAQRLPVLIAGAGPTGMMAALELSRFGISVRLVEKQPKPATTSRAIGVQARTLELLESRGLSQSLVEKGNHAVAASAYGGGKRVFRLEFSHIDSPYPYLLFVSQAETEEVLREALGKAGVTIEWSSTMTGFGESEQGSSINAVIQHENGSLEQIACSYLIAAEGAHSIVRSTLDVPFQGKSLDEQYALGDFYIDGDLPESDFHIFSSEHGFLGMFPMGKRRYRLIASHPISKPAQDTKPSIEELQALYDQRSALPVKFRDMSWSSWFHINSRMIHRMSKGRIFLGGDSAHIHSPAGAQGMNTGMQDMINLGWKMAMVLKGYARPQLLDTYSTERVPVIKNVLTKTEGLTAAIGKENAIFRSIFNHVAPWVVGTEFVQQKSTERMSQLALDYRGSPLAVSDGPIGSLRAGDRMPDLPVTLLDAGPTRFMPRRCRLFELLNPSAFTLFFINMVESSKTHAEVTHALAGWYEVINAHQIAPAPEAERFENLFGKTPGIVLVRPDGYIAFTGTERSISELARYCDQWLLEAPAEAPAASAGIDNRLHRLAGHGNHGDRI